MTDLQQTADGGFILIGFSYSSNTGNRSKRRLGSVPGVDIIQQTADGGFIVGGSSMSGTNGNKTSPFYGRTGPYYFGDYWLVRLDASGNKLWDQAFGGSGRRRD